MQNDTRVVYAKYFLWEFGKYVGQENRLSANIEKEITNSMMQIYNSLLHNPQETHNNLICF